MPEVTKMDDDLRGMVVDASPEPIKTLKKAEYFYKEPDNFYTLKEKYGYESIDNIISKDLIFKTKYHRILIKEWMNFCKVGGRVIIRFAENGKKDITFLLSEIFALFGNDVEVDWVRNNEELEVIIKKKKPLLNPGDSIDKWTFGIVTRGTKDGWIDKTVETITVQKIPKYEIIVCGKYGGKYKKDVRCIYFTEKDNLGWITKKKNLIMEKASYENVLVIHDRIFLGPNWFEGMKKYGNYFDVLSCPRPPIDDPSMRGGDWVAIRPDNGWVGYLEYRDWDDNLHVDGGLYMIKKTIWRRAPWNEYLFWNHGEDTELSRRYHRMGVVPRFNPYAQCYAMEWRHGHLPSFEFNSQKLGKLKLSTAEYMRRSLRPLRQVILTGDGIVPGFSEIFKKTKKSRLLFVSPQPLGDIIKTGKAYSDKEKIVLSDFEVSQLDKLSVVMYFRAKDSASGQMKRYKAVATGSKTQIYLDQVQ